MLAVSAAAVCGGQPPPPSADRTSLWNATSRVSNRKLNLVPKHWLDLYCAVNIDYSPGASRLLRPSHRSRGEGRKSALLLLPLRDNYPRI